MRPRVIRICDGAAKGTCNGRRTRDRVRPPRLPKEDSQCASCCSPWRCWLRRQSRFRSASSSSHREAPGISLDPSADNTDTYAWTAKDAPGALTVAADWIPGEVPANGPNFHSGSTTGPATTSTSTTPATGVLTSATGSSFKTKVRNKDSFLYALPGASGYNDPKLNVIQRYSIVRETYRYRRQEPQ